VLVIDMQNGFCDPAGSVVSAGFGLPGIDAVLAATAELVSRARAGGVPVVWTRHTYRADQLDRPARLAPNFPRVPTPLVRGSWDAAIVPALGYVGTDAVIDKNRFDAFLYTDLELVLRALGVSRLVVAGVVTFACVESTVRSAVQRDFDVHVAADCTAAPEPFHTNSLDVMAAAFATVRPWCELRLGDAVRA
jgi:ureidoacrylate peracid hydrolase